MARWAAAGVVREIREVLTGRIRRQVGTVSDSQAGKAASTVGRTLMAPTLAKKRGSTAATVVEWSTPAACH
jgi:hypothetical protein